MQNTRRPSTRSRARPATEDEHRFAEELGSYWEGAGGTRMAGRVLGALLLADPPGMSSSDLAEFLGISAGSVSIATRELIRPGLAERVRIPGDRQDHFRATMTGDALGQFLRNRFELNRRWLALMERGQTLARGRHPEVRRRLREMHELWAFLDSESAALLDRWERRARPGGR